MLVWGIHHWIATASRKAPPAKLDDSVSIVPRRFGLRHAGNLHKLRGPPRFEGRVKWFSRLLRLRILESDRTNAPSQAKRKALARSCRVLLLARWWMRQTNAKLRASNPFLCPDRCSSTRADLREGPRAHMRRLGSFLDGGSPIPKSHSWGRQSPRGPRSPTK